jgi:hypothetical protein
MFLQCHWYCRRKINRLDYESEVFKWDDGQERLRTYKGANITVNYSSAYTVTLPPPTVNVTTQPLSI